MNIPFIIVPFCIYHNKSQDGSHKGFIGYSAPNEHKNFVCNPPEPAFGSWNFYRSFYALSPMVRPIPTGLKLIHASQLTTYPYNTINIEYGYDPFDFDKDAVSFLTWTQSVQGTTPLYIYNNSEGYPFFTFDKKPPSEVGWTEHKLSPLFVLTNDDSKYPVNSFGIPEYKFSGNHGRCLPDPDGVPIEDCFLLTDEDILYSEKQFGPRTLLEIIKSEKEENNFFNKINLFAIVITFLISITICLIILSKN